MSYWPSQFSDASSAFSNVAPAQPHSAVPEKQNARTVKEAYNHRVQELKRRFKQDVNSIANKFSGRHVHRSPAQIRSQILFTMGEGKKTQSPHLSNVWAHATADAGQLDGKSLLLDIICDLSND